MAEDRNRITAEKVHVKKYRRDKKIQSLNKDTTHDQIWEEIKEMFKELEN